MKTLKSQQGGNHYKNLGIQPIEYIQANDINYLIGNAVKYLTRYKHKGNEIGDLKKAIHYIEIQIEYLKGGKK